MQKTRPEASDRPIKIDSTSDDTLKLMKLAQMNQPKSAIVLADGITTDQWKSISKFQIIGEKIHKKKNFNIAIDHYFNLKSMYKKINQIKYKNAVQVTAFEQTPVPEETTQVSKQKRKVAQPPVDKGDFHCENVNPNIHRNFKKEKMNAYAEEKKPFTGQREKIGKQTNVKSKKEAIAQEEPETKTDFGQVKFLLNMKPQHESAPEFSFKNSAPTEIQAQETEGPQPQAEPVTQELQKSSESLSDSGADEFETDPDNDGDLLDKIPSLTGQSDIQISNFKQQLLETIALYEIFGEDDFSNFYEAVCLKNSSIDRQFITDIFDEIRSYLCEQFEELMQQEEQELEEAANPTL